MSALLNAIANVIATGVVLFFARIIPRVVNVHPFALGVFPFSTTTFVTVCHSKNIIVFLYIRRLDQWLIQRECADHLVSL